jgi:hypothetical protein
MTEDEIRELAGYGGPDELSFLGETYKIRKDGLAALLRYSIASGQPPGEDQDQPYSEDRAQTRAMAAMYGLLEECVTDFGSFAVAAFLSKAVADDIVQVSWQLIEHYCARNHWPAMRLIGHIAQGLEEFDGNFLRATGRGLTSMNAREACNLALAILLDGRNAEDRELFLEDLNYQGNPEAEALAMVRQMQRDKAAAAREAEETP